MTPYFGPECGPECGPLFLSYIDPGLRAELLGGLRGLPLKS
jgi:hypothetical protein